MHASVTNVNVLDPWTFTGVLIGAMQPYAFSAMTMKTVGKAASDMMKECHRQFPSFVKGEQAPDYKRCIRISTKAPLREMIAPGMLVMLSPLVIGFCFGKDCASGLLTGALVSGIQMAISMSNTGGARGTWQSRVSVERKLCLELSGLDRIQAHPGYIGNLNVHGEHGRLVYQWIASFVLGTLEV